MIKGINMDPMLYRLASKQGLIRFYKEQLFRFKKIGMGNYTNFGVQITPVLINATERRLHELKTNLHTK
tara:strand:+ start:3729 stop:3935 length:207 start_codon:yes stop_codon:yes gene_type:complete